MTPKTQQAAQEMSGLVIVVGWGDGSCARALAEIEHKDVVVLALPGEVPGELPRGRIGRLRSLDEVRALSHALLGDHRDIPMLAGCAIIDDHPLSEEFESLRREALPLLETALRDLPQLYGNDIIDSLMGLHHAALNAPLLLASPGPGSWVGAAGHAPVISIAAGPSVARHVERLRGLQDRAFLVCAISALPGLVEAGIRPHACTPLERLEQDRVFVADGAGDTRFFGLPVVHPSTVRGFSQHAAVSGLDRVYDWLYGEQPPGWRLMTGSSTGVLSLTVSLGLGRGPIYLVGHDLCYAEGASHWTGAHQTAGMWAAAAASSNQGAGYDLRRVPRNGGGEADSTVWWDRYRGELSLLARTSGRQIINVGAHYGDGAVIQHALIGDLPEPASLTPHTGLTLAPSDGALLADFRRRARSIVEDSDRMCATLRDLGHRIVLLGRRPPTDWTCSALAREFDAAITGGQNGQAFSYLLRSQIHNSMALQQHHLRRCRDAVRARWIVLSDLLGLCRSIPNVMERVRDVLVEIRDV